MLNKDVIVKYTAETHDVFNRGLVSIYYADGKNYEEDILKAGLRRFMRNQISPQLKPFENLDKVYKNAEKTHKLDLVLLNKKTANTTNQLANTVKWRVTSNSYKNHLFSANTNPHLVVSCKT